MSRTNTLAATLALVACLTTQLHAAPRVAAGAQEGLPAPSFSAVPVNAPATSLAKLTSGEGVVLAFLDRQVNDGLRLLGYMQSQADGWRGQKIQTCAVVFNAVVRDTIVKFVQDNGLKIPVIHDAGGEISKQFGVPGGATAILVDHKGIVQRRIDSGRDPVDLGPIVADAVKKMLEDEAKAAAEAAKGADAAKPTAPATAPAAPTGPVVPTAPPVSDAEARQRMQSGLALLQKGFPQATLQDARALVDSRPTDPLCALWLAYVLEATRNYPEAAVNYRHVLALSPGQPYAAEAVQRIDPTGKWRSAADLPQAPKPAPEAQPKPTPEATAKPQPKDPQPTSGQGGTGIGD